MEKAILKTLIYADIFDYPLKINEIHKWLIGKKATLRQLEKAMKKLSLESRVKSQGEYYSLGKQNGQVFKRKIREKQSAVYFKKAKILSQILKMIPWVKLVGISGGLALNNASKKDDIDLFIITAKNRLWISRFLTSGLLSLIGQRRKRTDSGREIAGKLCLNILLEEDKLEQKNKDIYTAHEVLQMRVLWQRDGIYSKYLEDNEWVFKFLPNWVGSEVARRRTKHRSCLHSTRYGFVSRQTNSESLKKDVRSTSSIALIALDLATLIVNFLEGFTKRWQLKIMQKPKGMERIEEGALYFHPKDCRLEVLSKFKERISKLGFGTS